jgi:hypothetical protein
MLSSMKERISSNQTVAYATGGAQGIGTSDKSVQHWRQATAIGIIIGTQIVTMQLGIRKALPLNLLLTGLCYLAGFGLMHA